MSVILAIVDGSEPSTRTTAYAAGLAQLQRSKLILLYVKTAASTNFVLPDAIVAVAQSNREIEAGLRHQLDEYARRLGLETEVVVREGPGRSEVFRIAEDRRVDAIVIAAKTRTGHRFSGLLSRKLVRRASWPVVVVP